MRHISTWVKLLVLLHSNVADVQMAYKTKRGLHVLDDVCTQSWHVLRPGTEAVLKNH